MIDKPSVKKSFSKAAYSYDRHALFQREIADIILTHLSQSRTNYDKIFDIGAGTGFLSLNLAKKRPNSMVLSVDIAFGMSKIVRSKQNNFKNLRVITADIESLPHPDSICDLIVSNLSLQWVSDLKSALVEIFRTLKNNGAFFFSILGAGSLPELRESYYACFEPMEDAVMLNEYPSQKKVISILKEINQEHATVWKNTYIKTYKDAMEFLKTLKCIGATNPSSNGRHANKIQAMKKMLDYYNTRFMTSKGITATYEVIFVKGKK